MNLLFFVLQAISVKIYELICIFSVLFMNIYVVGLQDMFHVHVETRSFGVQIVCALD